MNEETIEITKGQLRALKREYWEEGDLEWKRDGLQNHITSLVRSNYNKTKKICILSSRQVGKSYWAMTHTIEETRRNPIIARFLAPTLSNCYDIVNDNLTKIVEDAPEGMIERRRSDMRWMVKTRTGVSNIRVGAMERAHVDKMGRGGNCTLAIFEECGFVKGDDFSYCVNSVIGPQLLRSNGWEIFVTSPPEDPDHPLITQIKPECEAMGTLFVFTVFDSPTITKAQIVSAMRRSGCRVNEQFERFIIDGIVTGKNCLEVAELTGAVISEAFKREYLAMILRSSTAMVVPGFIEKLHVVPFDPPSACKWTITIDWGGVRDMTVALLHTYDYYSDTDLVQDELVFPPHTDVKSIVDKIKERFDREYFIDAHWGDVAGQTQVELNALGYPVAIPQKSDWLAQVQAMNVRFTMNKMMINPACEFLIKSLRSGMLNKTKSDFERRDDIGHCDALAALMYGIRSQNRDNPYANNARPQNLVTLDKEDEGELALAKAMNPKRFGSFK